MYGEKLQQLLELAFFFITRRQDSVRQFHVFTPNSFLIFSKLYSHQSTYAIHLLSLIAVDKIYLEPVKELSTDSKIKIMHLKIELLFKYSIPGYFQLRDKEILTHRFRSANITEGSSITYLG